MNSLELMKEVFYVAYMACPGASGLGLLQAKPEITRDEVWNNVINNGDYPGDSKNTAESAYADYVFGRMMKLCVEIDEDKVVILTPEPFKPDYQSWCRIYPTAQDLLEAAEHSLSAKWN